MTGAEEAKFRPAIRAALRCTGSQTVYWYSVRARALVAGTTPDPVAPTVTTTPVPATSSASNTTHVES